MCFKAGVIVALLLVTVGCAKNSQDPEAGANFQLAIGATNCLDGMGTKFQGFFAGTGAEADIHSVWTCATKILQDFSQYTEGATPGHYTAAELQGFLNKYYFPAGISNDTIKSTLKLKQLVAGGVGDDVTSGELQSLIQAITVLDAATHDAFPVAKLLFTDADLNAQEADWFAAYTVMSGVVQRLSQLLAQSGQDYAFSDFQLLLQAWAVQLNLPKDHLLFKLAAGVPALASGKAVLIAGSATMVQSTEWQPLLSMLTTGYSYYRMLARLTLPQDPSALLGAARLPWLVEGVIGLLDQGVGRRPNKQIALSEIHDFLTGMQSQGFFPTAFTADQATTALQLFINKIFAAPLAPVDTLTDQTVSQMRSLLRNWTTYDAALVTQDFSNAAEFGASVRPAGIPMSFDGQGRLQLPGGPLGLVHEFSAIYAALEFSAMKWGTWPLSQTALDTMTSDCLTVLHALNLLTATTATVSKTLMRESNLFVLSSNGDLILDKAEAFQYAVYALSGYRSSRALSAASTSCAGNVSCISSQLYQNRSTLLANFPGLLAWLNSDPSLWAPFNQDLGAIVGTDQWLLQFVVIHYIETFMARFDQDHNQLIDLNESMVAFPVFHPILSILLPQNGLAESDVEPMYTFLFKYGNIPTNLSGGGLSYLFWKNSPGSWAYSSNRQILAGILTSLGAMTK